MRRRVVEITSMEDLVPKDHLLRKIDAAVDFTQLYDLVGSLYCPNNGRLSVDPVVLFKIVLIQHLFGIPSLRRTVSEIRVNIAYRWFLGYALNDDIPHFSTVSHNFCERFKEETIEEVFRWILYEANRAGYMKPETVYIDGTHIKANANINKKIKKQVPVASARYRDELMEEVNKDREKHDKPPFDNGSGEAKEKESTVSTTDPESGLFHKGEHKMCFAHEAHTACDDHNFILDVVVTPGNVHDSVAFHPFYDRLKKSYPELETIVADSAYKTPYICKRIFDDNKVLSTVYKRPKTMKGGHEWWKYVYDEYYDCIICPEYRTLHYTTTNRDGYREYKSRRYICEKCPTRERCIKARNCEKVVQRHIWQEYIELAEDIRYTPKYKELYKKRKEKIERVFADAKEKHGMRNMQYRGLTQVTKWVKLKFAAMNLKKLATWRWNDSHSLLSSFLSFPFSLQYSKTPA